MQIEIRPAAAAEMDQFMQVARNSYGLDLTTLKVVIQPEWTLCAFIDGKLATSYAAWPLKVYFSGAGFPAAGITWVSTHPACRRRNLLRQVIQAHFKRLYESREESIYLLHASMAAIYQRYGYAIVSSRCNYSVEPRYIRFSSGQTPSGQIREAGDNDIKLMSELYHRFASCRVGYLQRNEKLETAPGNPFSVLNVMPFVVGPFKYIYEENGKPLGYLIYSISRDMAVDPMGQRIAVHDLVWLSPDAYRAAWELLGNLDLVTRVDWNKAPPDDPLPHLLLEPRKLNQTTVDDLLGRIIDVERALTLRPYTEDGILTFEVRDEICPWNNGCWKLEASSEGSRVSRTTETAQTAMPVSTLAMLMFGQISPSRAAEMGRLEVKQPEALKTWDKVMRTAYRPTSADSF